MEGIGLFALICGGSIVLALIGLLFFGRTVISSVVFGLLRGIVGTLMPERVEDNPIPESGEPPPQGLDFQAMGEIAKEELDFEYAVQQAQAEQDEELQQAAHDVQQDTPEPGDHIDEPIAGVDNIQSPVHGRWIRDGRYRRVRGGTPGRETDQDFRQADAGRESSTDPDIIPD